ncbi:MAG: RIP metalloprotease, partial [Desulfovibrionaceae bacterium]
TEYKLSAVPLGGYVQLAGESMSPEAAPEKAPETTSETPPESGAPAEPGADFPESMLFSVRPAWQRLLVVLAGPVFNFILGWLIYWALFLSQGGVVLFEHQVQQVVDNSPAQAAGIEPGDVVTRVDGEPLYFEESLLLSILFGRQQPVTLTLESGGITRDVTITPRFLSEADRNNAVIPQPKIGIVYTAAERVEPLGLTLGSLSALHKAWAMIVKTLQSLWLVADGTASLKGIGGPIMIAQAVDREAHSGLSDLLLLAAFISINLGVLNLLPIPVLDGGHILFFGWEAVTRRPVNETVRRLATYFGIALLLALTALAFYNDISRILAS